MRILEYVIHLVEKFISLKLDVDGLDELSLGLKLIRSEAKKKIEILGAKAESLCVIAK